MSDDSAPSFVFPAICAKKVTAAFDGGRLTSDGGMLLLAQAERRLRLATALARRIADRRDQSRVIHDVDDILRARMLAIPCGYEDADDLDALRHDPGFKLALGKPPGGPVGLASQPTGECADNARTGTADGHVGRHLSIYQWVLQRPKAPLISGRHQPARIRSQGGIVR